MACMLLGPACIPWGHSSTFPGSNASKSTLLKLFGLGLLPLASASACTRTCCCCVLLERCASGATLRLAALRADGLPKLTASLRLVLHTCCPVRLSCMVAGVAMVSTLSDGFLPSRPVPYANLSMRICTSSRVVIAEQVVSESMKFWVHKQLSLTTCRAHT